MSLKGFYIQKDSWLHRLDPRTKMAYLVVSAAVVFIFFNPLAVLAVLFINLILIFLAKTYVVLKGALAKILLITLVLNIVVHGFASPAGKTPVSLFNYTLWIPFFESLKWEGMYVGLVFGLRIVALGLSLLFFVSTTHPTDFLNSLRRLGLPVKYTLMLSISLQLIPEMLDESRIILNAQRARGVRLKNSVDKLKAIISTFIPLTISSLEKMNIISMSILARGYGAPVKPTEIRRLGLKPVDIIVIFLTFSILALALYIRIFYGDLSLF